TAAEGDEVHRPRVLDDPAERITQPGAPGRCTGWVHARGRGRVDGHAPERTARIGTGASDPGRRRNGPETAVTAGSGEGPAARARRCRPSPPPDRKSTRLNSSHVSISYAVFCLKKKKKKYRKRNTQQH